MNRRKKGEIAENEKITQVEEYVQKTVIFFNAKMK